MGRMPGRIVALLAGVAALALPGAASAAEVIGQTAPPQACGENEGYTQKSLAAGASYSPSAYGVITSWTATALANSSGQLKLMVLEPTGGTSFKAVAKDTVVRTLTTQSALNIFTGMRLPIEPTQRLGLFAPDQDGAGNSAPCAFVTGNSSDGLGFTGLNTGEPPDNVPVDYPGNAAQNRLNAQAVVEPDTDRDVFGDESQDNCVGTPGTFNGCPNTVTISGLKQKGKKPKLSLTAIVPGQGKLNVGSASDATVATAAAKSKVQLKPVTQTFSAKSAQQVVLTLALTKSAKSKLRAKGKLKLQVKLAFTPTGGSAGSQLSQAKLKR
jgi:hypothetical protein